MIEIKVNASMGYKVIISKGIIKDVASHIGQIVGNGKIMLVTDEKVGKLYGTDLKAHLNKRGFTVFIHAIKEGEKYKNLASYARIVGNMADKEFNRKDTILALGGGVVGDLAGFAASTFMRGVNLIQIPTTLLASIDSAVGGKNGIDLPEGKNYVGTFYQPKLVLCDPTVFETLSPLEMQNGVGEGIKYAVLAGDEILSILESGLNQENMPRFIELCVKYKSSVVERDERERGERMLLNLGHTMGHAIEKISKYTIPHGQAIIKGLYMLITAPGAVALTKYARDTITGLIRQYEFDVTIPYRCVDLLIAAGTDKKAEPDNFYNLVIVKGIGNVEVVKLSREEMYRFFGHNPRMKIG